MNVDLIINFIQLVKRKVNCLRVFLERVVLIENYGKERLLS